MADRRGWEGGDGILDGRNARFPATSVEQNSPLAVSGNKIGVSKRRTSIRPSLEVDDLVNLLHGSDPVRVELTRLENEVRGGILIWIC